MRARRSAMPQQLRGPIVARQREGLLNAQRGVRRVGARQQAGLLSQEGVHAVTGDHDPGVDVAARPVGCHARHAVCRGGMRACQRAQSSMRHSTMGRWGNARTCGRPSRNHANQPGRLRADWTRFARRHHPTTRARDMNIAFPYHFDARGRTAHAASDDAHSRDMIEQVLFTAPGERVNRPDFGSGLLRLVFAPISDELAATTLLSMGTWQPSNRLPKNAVGRSVGIS